MAKTMKELLKNDNRHVFCDFEFTKFNLTKRTKEFVDQANAASVKAKGKPDRIAPSAPTGLIVTSALDSLTLQWTASIDTVGVTGYKLYLNGALVTSVSATTLSYQFTSLLAGTSYILAVSAFDLAGNNSVASSIQGTTLGGTTTTTTSTSTTSTTTSGSTTTTTTSGSTTTTTTSAGDTQAPTTPSITAITATETTISVSYTPSVDNVGIYAYRVGINEMAWLTANTAYTFTGLTPGTTYTITVAAIDTSDNYSGTATSQATTLTSGGGGGGGGGTVHQYVILCDFDGKTVSGTLWNTNGNIVCAPSGMTLDEQERALAEIQTLYAPYDITVTDDEAVYIAADRFKRTRVIFTQSWEWYGQAGGVAYINSMFWGDDTPCFVFTSLLGYNTRYIWAAGAHEAGHTIGLRHQSTYNSSCVKTAEYNGGNGVESPVMGVGYYLPPKWWIGPSSVCCTCIQDDNAILTSKIGLAP